MKFFFFLKSLKRVRKRRRCHQAQRVWSIYLHLMSITLIASPTYVKSRHCDHFLMFLCKNVNERAHAQLWNRSGTFFRARSKVRRLNVNEALFREDDYCLCRVHIPTILRCPEDFFLCKSSRMNLRGQKCLTTPEPSKQRVKKPVREIKKQIYIKKKKKDRIEPE